MNSNLVAFGLLLAVIIATSIISPSGCIPPEEEAVNYVEIHDYEGEKLSSIKDFRECGMRPAYLTLPSRDNLSRA